MVKGASSGVKNSLHTGLSNIRRNFKTLRLYLIAILFAIVSLLIFGKYALQPLLYVLGIILGYYSTMFGKIVPHIAPETMTIMSIFGGLMFGHKFGFIFGVTVSLIVYAGLGIIKLTTLLNSVVIGLGGLYAGFFMTTGLPISTCFLLSLITRTCTGVVLFWNITSDKIEAMTHAILDPIFNITIYMPIFLGLFNLFN